jgi:outer membrane protein OmpA-like peptidoglycan-associated protein
MKGYLFPLAAFLMLLAGCAYTLKIEDGAMAVDRKQYAVAVPLLKKEFRKAKSRTQKGEAAFLLAESYDQLGQREEAAEWYRVAYNNGSGVEALERRAAMLKATEQYAEAIEAYQEAGLEIGSPFEYRREIQGAESALSWLAQEPAAYVAEPVDFNSSSADYAPVLFGEGQLVFTSDRATATGDQTYNWTGRNFSDLFLVDLRTNEVRNFDAGINTDGNEGTATFGPGGAEMIFSRCTSAKNEDAFCSLLSSSRNPDGSWTPAAPLDFIRPNINYLHPALSADGRTLYFSADDPEGWGGFDIYVSERQEDGSWGTPTLLPRAVNSEKDEQFPYLDSDTLYFASSGHIGMGGLDIFKSHRNAQDRWSPAYNLKPPINSGADDFGFVIDRSVAADGEILAAGFFTSQRGGGAGKDDIYRYRKLVPPPAPPVVEEIEYRNLLDVYVLEKIYADPTDPNSKVLGRRPLVGAQLRVSAGDQSQTITVDEEGKLSLRLAEDTDYAFLAQADGFLNNTARFSSRGLGRDPANPVQRYEVEIVLDKIFIDREIVLENIYYDFDQYYIREDAQPTLNELAELLKLNPDIRIELGSHTDCRGADSYNQNLSRLRAQAAVDYLISQGIAAERLESTGYGEAQPVVDCVCARCTEEEHQRNRRTTFKILE